MTRRALRSMGNEKPAARARRLAGVAWAAYATGFEQPPDGGMFLDGYELGYLDAVRDMVDVDDERGG
jgi:hypothetical protein